MQRVCFDEVDGVGDNRSADQRELCITPIDVVIQLGSLVSRRLICVKETDLPCNSRLRFTSQDRYSATPAATDGE